MTSGENPVKNSSRLLIASLLSLTLLPFAASSAQSDEGASPDKRPEMTREERLAAWESLSEEEKQAKREKYRAKREQRRAEWEAMTPEQREAKRAEMKKRMEAMSPEEREAMQQRRKRQAQHGKRKNQDGEKDQGE